MANVNAQTARVKLSASVSPRPTDRELDFFSQLGIPYAYTWLDRLAEHTDVIADLIRRLAERGITLNNAGDMTVGKSPNIHLATPERDHDIDRFADTLRALSKLGVYVTTFTWEPDMVWSNGHTVGRGGSTTRFVDERALEKLPVKHGRVYEKDELWENFAYFMKRIIPVCEETGVKLALHPNDPPMPMIAGIATLINSIDDYRKAFSIANSPYLGMEFCCGCWLEGGRERFGDIFEGIREFVRDGRVFITHFRNITSPMPQFAESFLDDGYADMFRIMETFVENDYDGTIIYDHLPGITAGSEACAAYLVGYMKALLSCAVRKANGTL